MNDLLSDAREPFETSTWRNCSLWIETPENDGYALNLTFEYFGKHPQREACTDMLRRVDTRHHRGTYDQQ